MGLHTWVSSSFQSRQMFWGAQDRVLGGLQGDMLGKCSPSLAWFFVLQEAVSLSRNQALEEGIKHQIHFS